ncbi:MAG: YaaL family protein [Thermoanaerobacteraceae bacterium]|uniref:DUF2508 family protein n=1 Tax=Thermanaeromonas sp. C210 TaxID=2731925 RepID=UPI00155BBF29|nr:DUF2508 family protein [Thermanaeromonas sp. C210]MBE3580840.1 YaaL family protein [Thermoanaerobacteraceae bacterium]GFN21689.1 hypothetical protein TAMC210_00050 [Thermanaeromonas sp. C210]
MPSSSKELPADVEVLVVALKEAQQEWMEAQNLFSEVTEPDLVDQAIYRLQAAERKFMYLYKEVQQKWMGGG